MTENETQDFFALLDQACEALGKPAKSVDAKMMFLTILGGYGYKNLRGAVLAHLSDPDRGRFVPTPADLKAQIDKALERDGRPTADEAWAIAVQLEDEHATVVSNDEISQAWGAARDIMPDRVGARMAFKQAYERLIADARANGRPVSWFASLGMDVQGREGPLQEAVRKGLLLESHVQKLLPAPVNNNAMLQLTNNAPNTEAKEAMAKLKGLLIGNK